jgi:transcriptional regulator with XRE-family HTH domain
MRAPSLAVGAKKSVRSMADMADRDGSLGDRVRHARVTAGWSLRDLAKRLTKTPSYLSDIENDRRVPSEETLADLARILELDFDELMAAAGRFGDDTDRYLRRQPTAGVLMRRLTQHNLDRSALESLLKQADRLGQNKRG